MIFRISCQLLIVIVGSLALPPTQNAVARYGRASPTNPAVTTKYNSSSSSNNNGRGTRDFNPFRNYSQRPKRNWLLLPPRGGGVGTANANSYGLAYRSILPIRGDVGGSGYYPKLYRNRNIFDNEEYNYDAYLPISPPKDNNAVAVVAPVPPTVQPSRPKSAPATTKPGPGLSSTKEMREEEEDEEGPIISRDSIGINMDEEAPPISQHHRQGKGGKVPEDQESIIIFPGSTSGAPAAATSRSSGGGKRLRPGKTRYANAPDSTANVASTMGPGLQSLDKAALESLRILLETRKKASAQQIAARNGGKYALDIKGRPKCLSDNSGYCEDVDSYPKELFNQYLKNSVSSDVFKEVFGDSIDNKTAVATDLVGRDGLNMQFDSPLCNSIEHTIYPKVAENKEGKFMYIVNHDEYIQGVRVEKCVKENSPCMYLEGSLSGYQSTCRQKYIYRKLLAFTKDGKPTTDTFRLPACCVCHVRSLFVDDRININVGGFSGGGVGGDDASSSTGAAATPSSITDEEVAAGAGPPMHDDTNGTVFENIAFDAEAPTNLPHESQLQKNETVLDASDSTHNQTEISTSTL